MSDDARLIKRTLDGDRARPVALFLFAIATNLWRERARKTHRDEQPLDKQQPAEHSSVAEQAMLRLEHGRILAAVARLRPEQREALSLYYDQGLSYREIARITRAPVGTVSTRLRRALEALRRALPSEAAGLAIIAGGQAPPATALVTALQRQGGAPSSLAPAVAHSIGHIAPAGLGLLHGGWTLWKQATPMVKGICVAPGLAAVGGTVAAMPRLVSAVRPASAGVRQAKQAIMPSIPQGIHLTYEVTSQEFAWPPVLYGEGDLEFGGTGSCTRATNSYGGISIRQLCSAGRHYLPARSYSEAYALVPWEGWEAYPPAGQPVCLPGYQRQCGVNP
jgi:RNA polymerase sigma factor (sigma-70 family)